MVNASRSTKPTKSDRNIGGFFLRTPKRIAQTPGSTSAFTEKAEITKPIAIPEVQEYNLVP